MVQPIDEVTSPVDELGQSGGGGGGDPGDVSWGDINGTLSHQTDLHSALSNKVNTSALGAPNGVATLDADGSFNMVGVIYNNVQFAPIPIGPEPTFTGYIFFK